MFSLEIPFPLTEINLTFWYRSRRERRKKGNFLCLCQCFGLEHFCEFLHLAFQVDLFAGALKNEKKETFVNTLGIEP